MYNIYGGYFMKKIISNSKVEKIYYFAATHWDREWYKTVDEFRYKLIPTMDTIIDTVNKNSNFEYFTLDGQTCILEDYLAIRENTNYASSLKKLIQNNKIIIGPWYTMPDQFLVSSESIIQNLLLGHKICDDYGIEPLKLGYVCDTFGHIANLPQILNSFNINSALISRGVNDHDTDCFFNWQSPDGSNVLTFKAPEVCGYGSYYFEVLAEFNPNFKVHIDEIVDKSITYIERELSRTSLPYVLLMDGMDHESIHEFIPEVLEKIEKHYNCPVVQMPLDLVFNEISANLYNDTNCNNHKKDQKQTTRFGELADLSKAYNMHDKLIPHTLSSRYDLKIANDLCQMLLEYYAMPTAALRVLDSTDSNFSFIEYSYPLLLQNHAHDSICGCSIDDVHKEMLVRFFKVKNTAEEFFFQFNATDVYNVNTCSNEDYTTVKIFNPLPYEYSGSIEFDIDFDEDFAVQSLDFVKYEQRNSFVIYDEEEKEVTYNIISAKRKTNVKAFNGNKRLADTHRVAVVSKLKPMGYTTFEIKPFSLPYRITERFSTSHRSCENEFISFEIANNGSITITEKSTGEQYSNLHTFIDTCEMGDGWFHIKPINNAIYSSIGNPVSIQKTFDGYAECKFVVEYAFRLPKEKTFDHDFCKRSDETDICIIKSEFTISRFSPLISVKTIVKNNIRDHRLQLNFPTNIDTNKYYVDQGNLILERVVGINNENYTWKEHNISEKSFQNLVFMTKENTRNNNGFLFISKGGLHEVSCIGDKYNSIDITLLRAFNKTVNTDGEIDGQLQVALTFEYGFMPIVDKSNNDIVKIMNTFTSNIKAFTIPKGNKTINNSYFYIESKSCSYLTMLPSKTSENSIIIRVVNNENKKSKCKICFTLNIKQAISCNFLEDKLDTLIIVDNTIYFSVEPNKIMNIKILKAVNE